MIMYRTLIREKTALRSKAGLAPVGRMLATLAGALLLAACGSEEAVSSTLTEMPFGDDTVRIDWSEADTQAASVRVILLAGDSERLLYESEILNDGDELTPQNVRAGIGPQSELRLCLNGAGQPDVSVRIYPSTSTVIESDQTCTQ